MTENKDQDKFQNDQQIEKKLFQGRTLSAAPAKHDFSYQDREGHEQDAQKVNQHKCTAAVLAGDVREFPDVAQPDGCAHSRQQKGEAG